MKKLEGKLITWGPRAGAGGGEEELGWDRARHNQAWGRLELQGVGMKEHGMRAVGQQQKGGERRPWAVLECPAVSRRQQGDIEGSHAPLMF